MSILQTHDIWLGQNKQQSVFNYVDLPLSFSGYFVKGCLEFQKNTTYALAFLSSNKDPSSTCHHVGKSTALLQPLARPETNKTIPMAIQCTL